jgi:hypothetical protein
LSGERAMSERLDALLAALTLAGLILCLSV